MTDADEIKEQFIYQKRKTAPTYANFPKALEQFYGSFQKAADICNELGATAEEFVQAQFDNIPADKFWASYLHNTNCREYYEKFKNTQQQVQSNVLEYWMYYLRCGIETGKKLEEVLNDDTSKIPAWFRVICTLEPNEQVIKKYQVAAKKQLTPALLAYLQEQKQPIERIIPNL